MALYRWIQNPGGLQMTEHVYKTIELTGTSTDSVESAVDIAIMRASETLHNLRWFEVTTIRGEIENQKVSHWQVSLKVGFTLDDNPNG
jgi:flavin-binding protein dodecin